MQKQYEFILTARKILVRGCTQKLWVLCAHTWWPIIVFIEWKDTHVRGT